MRAHLRAEKAEVLSLIAFGVNAHAGSLFEMTHHIGSLANVLTVVHFTNRVLRIIIPNHIRQGHSVSIYDEWNSGFYE